MLSNVPNNQALELSLVLMIASVIYNKILADLVNGRPGSAQSVFAIQTKSNAQRVVHDLVTRTKDSTT